MDGPRGTRIEEKDSLKKCVGTVFRPTLWEEYPQLFNDDDLENCRVMVHQGQVVAHIGMLIRDASILGCRIRACNIGGVGTLPDYRKRGLATQTFADCCAKAKRDGCDIVIVSGDRSLYRMAGCRRVGRDVEYIVTREDVARLGRGFNPCRGDVAMEPAQEKDQETMMRLYQREPVRFIRRREDYTRAMQCGFVMNRPSDFWLIRQGGAEGGPLAPQGGADALHRTGPPLRAVTAYLIFNRPKPEDKQTRIAEYAGSRCAVAAALPLILANYRLEKLTLHVLGCDTALQALMTERGIAGATAPGSGTVRMANFPQFMERMRPYFEETLGLATARKLSFAEEEDDRFLLICGDERARITNRGDVSKFLFGAPDNSDRGILPEDNAVARALRPALPIPVLWYGISYV